MQRLEQFLEAQIVLFSEDLRGRHQRGLQSRFDRQEHRGESDKGLAGSDIALEEAIHAMWLLPDPDGFP